MRLSSVALGCEPLGGADWGAVDATAARDTVRCALDLGVTVFDTADVYGLGRSEEELSRALAADRHRVTIVTKGGIRWTREAHASRAATHRDGSAAYLRSAIEASLKRLQIETIPLYLVYLGDERTPLGETLDCMDRARTAGLIAEYGLSNVGFDVARDAVADRPFAAVEAPLNLLQHASLLADYKALRGMGLLVLTYGPLAQGALTGKYSARSAFDVTDRRHRLDLFSAASWPRNEQVLEALTDVATKAGRTPAQTAIRWVIDSGGSDTVIVGAKTPVQMTENMGAVGWSLSEHQLQRLSGANQVTAA